MYIVVKFSRTGIDFSDAVSTPNLDEAVEHAKQCTLKTGLPYEVFNISPVLKIELDFKTTLY